MDTTVSTPAPLTTPPAVVVSTLWQRCIAADVEWQQHLATLYQNCLPHLVVLFSPDLVAIIAAYAPMLRHAPHSAICDLHPFTSRAGLADATWTAISNLFQNVVGLRVHQSRLEMCCSRGTEQPLVLTLSEDANTCTIHLRTALPSEMEPFVTTRKCIINDDMRAPDGAAAAASASASRLDRLRLCMNESAALCAITLTGSQRLWLDAAACAYAQGAGELITSGASRRSGTSTLYNIAVFAIHLMETRLGGKPGNLAPTVLMGQDTQASSQASAAFLRSTSAYTGSRGRFEPHGNAGGVVVQWDHASGAAPQTTRVDFRVRAFGQSKPPKLVVLDFRDDRVTVDCVPMSAVAENGFTMRNGLTNTPSLYITEHTKSQFIFAPLHPIVDERSRTDHMQCRAAL